jgi:capsular polysaccharide transport system ATP-binding protein
MIVFDDVTDHVEVFDRPLDLLDHASIEIPPGRYGLLVTDPLMRRPLVDLFCGTRPPHRGAILRDERPSWAIGRTTAIRGGIRGSDLLGIFCRLYDLDRRYAEAFIGDLVEDDTLLGQIVEHWPALTRAEFGLAMALLPRFGTYVTDGNVLFSPNRFGTLWRRLFEQRIAGNTLIISSFHISNISAFCEKALIVDNGVISIVDDLDEAVDRYPPRPPIRESGRDSAGADDGDSGGAEPF